MRLQKQLDIASNALAVLEGLVWKPNGNYVVYNGPADSRVLYTFS